MTNKLPDFSAPITITIDADWIESLCETQDKPYINSVLTMLRRYDDVLYDYIDDAIREMIEREEKNVL
jgi:hypothetical protein